MTSDYKKVTAYSDSFQPPAGTPLQPAGSVTVPHEDKPREAPSEIRRIHPRRPLPATPESTPKDSTQGREE